MKVFFHLLTTAALLYACSNASTKSKEPAVKEKAVTQHESEQIPANSAGISTLQPPGKEIAGMQTEKYRLVKKPARFRAT